MSKRKKWLIKASEPVLQPILAKKLGVSPLMAQLLINRGIYTVRAARDFLNVSFAELHQPELMRDLPEAVALINKTLEQSGKILVYGDYDVDGVTGTALLVDVLRRLGGQVEYYIPHRLSEGYGLHTPALQKARESGVSLVLTVDCGISGLSEVEEANRSGGPEIIITDHHEPPAILPKAAAVVNPKRKDCPYPFSELAGVGVAFKLVQALLASRDNPFSWEDYLDLVCLGTVADIVPLHGENRILVRHGQTYLGNSARPGLQALCQVSGIQQETITAWEVGFLLSPRINAAGRLDDAGIAVEMLLSEDYDEAMAMANSLDKANKERQSLEAATLTEALAFLEQDPELAGRDVLVLASANWHPGVIGIVASRLVDRFYKPVLLIACDQELGKGSARSISGFHLYNALEHCADCLTGYGGHAMAAGFSLPMEQVNTLREKINGYAAVHLNAADTEPVIELDALVSLEDITYELINEIEQLAPYGHGNPGPVFALQQAKLVSCRGVGKNNAHLKMLLSDHSVAMDGIGFNLGQFAEELAAAKEVSVAFTPEVNVWQGRKSLQVKVQDMHWEPGKLIGWLQDGQLQQESTCSAGDLILVPETIISLLQEFISTRGYSMPHGMQVFIPAVAGQAYTQTDQSGNELTWVLAPVAHVNNNPVPTPVGAFKEKKLTRLSASLGCTLLVANSACNALQVYRYMEEHNQQFSANSTYLHGYMPQSYINDQLDKIRQQRIKLVVATPVCLGESLPTFFDRVLLVRPPAMAEDWQRLTNLSGAQATLRLEPLYDIEDWEENRSFLEELAPERDVLVHYYALLRSLAPGGTGACSQTALQERMAAAGYEMHSSISLIVAMAVFADLDLLQFHWRGDMLKYKLLPLKGRKMNLNAAPTFNWAHKIKTNGMHWINLNLKQEEV